MVSITLQGPPWFFGVDATLEAIIAVIAFFVTVASLRVWRVTKEPKYGWFTASFGLLTLSFLSRALTDTIVEELLFACPKEYLPMVFYFGYLTHIVLALIAFIMLFTVTHKIENKSVVALLYLILIPSLILSSSYFLSFYGISFAILLFITIAYYLNYKKVQNVPSGMVFVAFLLLTLAQAFFLFEAVNDWWYVFAQASQAMSFVLLLLALLTIKMKYRKVKFNEKSKN